jgi:hypothetical protein
VSRRSRARYRAAAAKAAPRNPGGVTLSGDQLAAFAASQRAGTLATPLPRPPQWSADPFGPGAPLTPAPINQRDPRTGRAQPRLFELPISTNLNIATAPFVPWKVLSDFADVPLPRKCIQRRKSVCELGFTVAVDPKAVARAAAASGDAARDVEAQLRKRYMAEIARVSDWMENPDRKNGYDWAAWTGQLMENRLVYDAVAVYPRRARGGDLFALEVVDGSTIKPLLDEGGGRPLPPAPFAQQILYGFPRGEFVADTVDVHGKTMVPGGMTTDQLLYERTIIRPKTPYGMSATEIALLDGILWMRRMGWLLAEYATGVTGAMLETAPEIDWDVTQWRDYAQGLNDMLRGDDAARLAYHLLPPGVKAVLSPEVAERYKPEMDLFLVKLVAGDYGLPASEVGFTEAGALGASFHEGEEDILNRQTRLPDSKWIGSVATRLARQQLGMPSVLQIKVLGLESEDEAAADQVGQNQFSTGRATLNEDRARRGEPPYGFPEADMPMVVTREGVVFIKGASEAAPPGALVKPAQAAPAFGSQMGAQAPQPGPGAPPKAKGGAQPPPQQPANSKPRKQPKPAKAAKAIAKGPADEVFAQLAEDYPKAALDWVHHVAWEGPLLVPFSQVNDSDRDSWRASHEPDRVAHFADKIDHRVKGGKTPLKKPAVLVSPPGKDVQDLIVDGHHRFLGSEQSGEADGIWAWVGHVAQHDGPWMELHDLQFSHDSGSGPGSGDDVAADQVGKSAQLTELGALRRWLYRHPSPPRPFECQVLTAEHAPEYVSDPRVLLKDGRPKALRPTGRAGSATWS